jgi:glycosyltransferase involved in cell wall biosynthesis
MKSGFSITLFLNHSAHLDFAEVAWRTVNRERLRLGTYYADGDGSANRGRKVRLGERGSLDYLNTRPAREKRPGGLDASNLGLTIRRVVTVFRRARHADVAHLNLALVSTLPLLRALALSVAGKLAGAKVILHAHAGGLKQASGSSVLYRALMRTSSACIDVMLVVSRDSEAALERLRSGVRFLPNGIDVSPMSPDGERNETVPTIAFVGTVCERKGLMDLRDALVRVRGPGARVGPLRLMIVGDEAREGPGAFERVRDASEASEVENVTFWGPWNRERSSIP